MYYYISQLIDVCVETWIEKAVYRTTYFTVLHIPHVSKKYRTYMFYYCHFFSIFIILLDSTLDLLKAEGDGEKWHRQDTMVFGI